MKRIIESLIGWVDGRRAAALLLSAAMLLSSVPAVSIRAEAAPTETAPTEEANAFGTQSTALGTTPVSFGTVDFDDFDGASSLGGMQTTPTRVMSWTGVQEQLRKGESVRLTSDIICTDQSAGPLVVPEGKAVTLDLAGHAINRSLKAAAAQGHVLEVAGDLTLTDSGGSGRLLGGFSEQAGGGIVVSGVLRMQGGTVDGCTSAVAGGGILVAGGAKVTLSGKAKVTGCTAPKGGGVQVENTGALIVKADAVISGCAATFGGGIFVCVGAQLNMSGGTVEDNKAGSAGGGIAVIGTASVTGGTIKENAVDGNNVGSKTDGGKAASGETTNEDTGSTASASGTGSRKVKFGEADIEPMFIPGVPNPNYWPQTETPTVTDDSGTWVVGGGGLAVNVSTASLKLSGAAVTGNTSIGSGGGLLLVAGEATVGDTSFSGNTATYDGGGICVSDGTLNIETGTSLSGNVAGRFGGSIANDKGTVAYHAEPSLSGNRSRLEKTYTWETLQEELTVLSKTGGTIVLGSDVVCTSQKLGPLLVKAQPWNGGEREEVNITLDLNGHTIDRALASPTKDGCVFKITMDGNFTVTDGGGGGKITGGNSTDGGGAFVIETESYSIPTLILKGGTITGNRAAYGSAAALFGPARYMGRMELYSAVITGNYATGTDADKFGSAVWVDTFSSCRIFGGEIVNNDAAAQCKVGGVYDGSGRIIIAGTPKITGNLIGGTQTSNLATNSALDVSGIENGAKVGISWANGVAFGKNAASGMERCFFADTGDEVTYSNGYLYIKESYKPTRLYLLETVTGVSPGDRIEYIALRYLDTGNHERVEYVFPQNNAADDANTFAAGYGEFKIDQNLLSSMFGYSLPGYSSRKALQSYQQDQFLIETKYDLKSVVDIELFCRYQSGSSGTVKNEWSCQRMNLYQVTALYGLKMYGRYSSQYYIDFAGIRIASLEQPSFNFSWATDLSDKLFRIGTDKNKGYTLQTSFTDRNYNTHAQAPLLFKLDVADTYGAGIESFTAPYNKTTTFKDLPKTESLAMELVYNDTYGNQRRVSLPVITSAAVSMMELSGVNTETVTNGGTTMNVQKLEQSTLVAGFMQQGESIVFQGILPDFKSIVSCALRFGTAAAKSSVGYTGDRFSSTLVSSTEKLALAGLSIYNAQEATVNVSVQGAGIVTDVIGEPLYYFTAPSAAGQVIEYVTSATADAHKISLNNYVKGDRLTPKEPSDRFLVILTTDSVPQAGTASDIGCRLHYRTVDGAERQTEFINTHTATQEFYGYWPGSGGDVAYKYGAASGGKLMFLVQLQNVDCFTGASFRLENEGVDEWQCARMEIIQLTSSLGRRSVVWESVSDAGGQKLSDRRYFRAYSGEDISPPAFADDSRVLVQEQDTMRVNFETESIITEENDVDWSNLRYSMSYAETKQNLGFKKARASYIVSVKVAGDVVSEGDNGDCGSQNQFYFQLVFEQGKSSYVLANQQLSADGFRSGQTETFRVTTNQDYGNVSAVNIIPEDPNNPDGAFDKLKLDYIEVKRESGEAMVATWHIEINDWINIDYVDIGARDSISGQAGRSESEIARSYLVTTNGYSVNLLFALTTGLYDAKGSQFDGALRATISYTDIDGNLQEEDIDVFSAMYAYMKRTPKTASMSDGSGYWPTNVTYAMRDKNFMLRENSTDRFIVALSNVKSVNSVSFHLMSRTSGTWNIKDLTIYRITSPGVLNINAHGEYQSSAKVEELCHSDYDGGYSVWFPLNQAGQSQEISMSENDLSGELTVNGWISNIDYVPKSRDDRMNIYVYMSEDASPAYVMRAGREVENYHLRAAVQYGVSSGEVTGSGGETTEVVDGCCQVAADLYAEPGSNVFKAVGLQASGMTNVQFIKLKSYSMESCDAVTDHVIIEQVRSGVVIDTYYISIRGQNAEFDSCQGAPSADPTAGGATQTVMLMFDEQMPQLALIGKVNDVAVALNYTSANAPKGTSLTSPNLFLSEESVGLIRGGQIIALRFDQQYVGEITGISLTALGTLSGKVSVRMACVGCYDALGSCAGWYSFGEPLDDLTITTRHMERTAAAENGVLLTEGRTVSPMTMVIRTAPSTGVETGTATPVRMRLVYEDINENTRELVYDDITPYLTSGSFAAGAEAKLELMVPNFSRMRYIEVEPHDDDRPYESATWTVESVRIAATVNGQEASLFRTVGTQAVEGTGLKINLSDVTLSADVLTYSARSETTLKRTVRSDVGTGTAAVLVESGQPVRFRPALLGSLDEIDFTCERVVGSASADADGCMMYSEDGSELVFTPLENKTSVQDNYRITLFAKEIPSVCVVIELTVEGGALRIEELQATALPLFTAAAQKYCNERDGLLDEYMKLMVEGSPVDYWDDVVAELLSVRNEQMQDLNEQLTALTESEQERKTLVEAVWNVLSSDTRSTFGEMLLTTAELSGESSGEVSAQSRQLYAAAMRRLLEERYGTVPGVQEDEPLIVTVPGTGSGSGVSAVLTEAVQAYTELRDSEFEQYARRMIRGSETDPWDEVVTALLNKRGAVLQEIGSRLDAAAGSRQKRASMVDSAWGGLSTDLRQTLGEMMLTTAELSGESSGTLSAQEQAAFASGLKDALTARYGVLPGPQTSGFILPSTT